MTVITKGSPLVLYLLHLTFRTCLPPHQTTGAATVFTGRAAMLASGTARWSLHQSCLLEASSDKIERLTSLENLFCCSKPPSNTQPADIVGDKGSKRSDSFLFCLNIPSSLCLAEVKFDIGKINGVYFAVKKNSILISTNKQYFN